MLKFLSKTLLQITILVFVGFCIFEIVERGLKNSRLGSVSEGIHAEVLIIGSSRAYRHFDTDQLSTIYKKNFFNLGLDASGFRTQLALLKYYLKYNKYPKEVIWEYNFGFLNEEDIIYEHQNLITFADEEMIYDLMTSYNLMSYYNKLIPKSRYLGNQKLIKEGILNYFKPKSHLLFKVQDLKWNSKDFEEKYLNGNFRYDLNISEQSKNEFLKIIDDLNSQNIKLTMVFTPMYNGIFNKHDGKEKTLKYYDSLFISNKIRNIDLLNSKI